MIFAIQLQSCCIISASELPNCAQCGCRFTRTDKHTTIASKKLLMNTQRKQFILFCNKEITGKINMGIINKI